MPGCGRAYDLKALASPQRKVIGIDIVEVAVNAARDFLATEANIPDDCDVTVSLTNFFDIKPEKEEDMFDFVYDYTFMCALNPTIRPDWAAQMKAIIKPQGELVTLIYPVNDKPLVLDGPPPFPVSLDLYRSLLEPIGFECLRLEMLPIELCHPEREGTSGIGRWRRK